jgi:predicted Zn-dependent protease
VKSSLASFAVVIVLLVSGCASTRVSPVRDSKFVPEEDEQEIWNRAAKVDELVLSKELAYGDEPLQAYLDEVTARLLPHLGAGDVAVRVRVIKDPFLNAFALPNGTVYLHSGILARIENEAQLATVLGHELTHFLERHSLRQTRSAENRATAAKIVVGILAVAAAGASGDAQAARLVTQLAHPVADVLLTAHVQGYSRDLEREADRRSLEAVIAAGYDGREAPKVFAHLQHERLDTGGEEPYYFGSHPRLEERLASYTEVLAAGAPADANAAPRVGADVFDERISNLLLDNAKYDLRLRRFGPARDAVERHLRHRPDSARGQFMLGDVHRRSGDGAAEMAAATAAYEAAIRLDAGYADAYRELGLMYRAQGRGAEARAQLERYAQLAPQAPDTPIVQVYLEELKSVQGPRR